jgi:pyruvate/2-oxoglutarate dehydrogenase complex dihydrolipoamide acyltransferase (E2) component
MQMKWFPIMPIPILLPDLGSLPAKVSLWFAQPGDHVFEGDRIVEILCGVATFDVSAPVSGKLVERVALKLDHVVAGQILGLIEPDSME